MNARTQSSKSMLSIYIVHYECKDAVFQINAVYLVHYECKDAVFQINASPLRMHRCSLPNQCCLSSPLRMQGHSLPNKCCLSSPLRMHRCSLPNQLTDAWTQSFPEKISYFEGEWPDLALPLSGQFPSGKSVDHGHGELESCPVLLCFSADHLAG